MNGFLIYKVYRFVNYNPHDTKIFFPFKCLSEEQLHHWVHIGFFFHTIKFPGFFFKEIKQVLEFEFTS